MRHLGEAIFEFTDMTFCRRLRHGVARRLPRRVLRGRLPSHEVPVPGDSFVVSGSTNQDGTYQQNGLCESLPYYECETCGSDQRIWYDTGKWYIGSGGCGSTAEISVDDPDQDLRPYLLVRGKKDDGVRIRH